MSIKVTSMVRESDINIRDRRVLEMIADFTNDEGKGCWASTETLMYLTGYKERTVRAAIKSLKNKGIITYHGNHPTYRTNVWNINLDKIPFLGKKEWKRRLEAGEPLYGDGETSEEDEDEGAEIAPIRVQSKARRVHLSASRVQLKADEGAVVAPNPLVDNRQYTPQENRPIEIRTADASESEESEPASRNKDPKWITPWDNGYIPPEDRPDIDGYYEREPEDEDPKSTFKPRTDLERLIIKLIGGNARYISESMRRSLASPVRTGEGKGLNQEYPSPEDEYRRHRDEFHAYVIACYKDLRAAMGVPPSRSALINRIRAYGVPRVGWIAFKAVKETESQVTKPRPGSNTNGRKYYE